MSLDLLGGMALIREVNLLRDVLAIVLELVVEDGPNKFRVSGFLLERSMALEL